MVKYTTGIQLLTRLNLSMEAERNIPCNKQGRIKDFGSGVETSDKISSKVSKF